MTPDYLDLLDKIAKRMEAVTSVAYTNAPRGLFICQLHEASSSLATNASASVLRMYGGQMPWVPTPTVSIQCMTTAPKDADADGLDRSALLLSSLVDSNNQPLRNVALTGFKILGFLNITTPAQVARDEKGRALWVFNFDAKFVPTA